MKALDYISLIPANRRRRVTRMLIGISVVLGLTIAVLDRQLADAGEGTIAFEFAGTPNRAAEIVDTWTTEGVLADAAFINGLDYLFALAYSLALAAVCVAAAMHWRGAGRRRRAEVSMQIAILMPLAGALDWIENAALATSLLGEPSAPWPAVAMIAAIPKFALVAAGIGCAVAGGVSALRSR